MDVSSVHRFPSTGTAFLTTHHINPEIFTCKTVPWYCQDRAAFEHCSVQSCTMLHNPKTSGNWAEGLPLSEKGERNPLTLKDRKTRSGQGQMVPREIITQTSLKERENWAWIIFQLINHWNGANSTSGPGFLKLQVWVTLTSYCLRPSLSNQTRKPIP